MKDSVGDQLDIVAAGQQYLELAYSVELPHPRRTAMMAALAVANADGVVGEKEERELMEMAKGLGLDAAKAASEIAAIVLPHDRRKRQ